MVKCDKCNNDAVIYLAYGPHNYCKNHFNDKFEKRFKKTIRQYKLIKNNDYLGIATSGGKDSMVLLYLINKIFKPRKLKFCAIFVDEGTPNYSKKTYKIVKDFFQTSEQQTLGKIVLDKPIVSSKLEKQDNPRARSAKLRIFQKK